MVWSSPADLSLPPLNVILVPYYCTMTFTVNFKSHQISNNSISASKELQRSSVYKEGRKDCHGDRLQREVRDFPLKSWSRVLLGLSVNIKNWLEVISKTVISNERNDTKYVNGCFDGVFHLKMQWLVTQSVHLYMPKWSGVLTTQKTPSTVELDFNFWACNRKRHRSDASVSNTSTNNNPEQAM